MFDVPGITTVDWLVVPAVEMSLDLLDEGLGALKDSEVGTVDIESEELSPPATISIATGAFNKGTGCVEVFGFRRSDKVDALSSKSKRSAMFSRLLYGVPPDTERMRIMHI